MDLHITVHDEAGPGTRVLYLAGEAHQDNAGPLRAALADALDRAPAPRTLIRACPIS